MIRPKCLRLFFLVVSIVTAPASQDSLRALQYVAKSVDELVAELASEDEKVVDAAKGRLDAMGPDVVPALFEYLIVGDWPLKPRLLEVLSDSGREFAKANLVKGDETEKIYAALVFELYIARTAQAHDYGSPEYKAMVEALLKGIKSDDKRLRAAAGLALIYDERSTVWFEHFHEIVPALISSFDTELVIDRRHRGGPGELFILIGGYLDGLIGDRLAHSELVKKWSNEDQQSSGLSPEKPSTWQEFLGSKSADIDELRAYWVTWWEKHSRLTPKDIGIEIMERNLQIMQDDSSKSSFVMVAEGSASKWAGPGVRETYWPQWWKLNKQTYRGPVKKK